MFKPFIFSEFLINITRSSAHIIKIYGDRGSPCLHPCYKLIKKNSEVHLQLYRAFIQFLKDILKLNSSNAFSKTFKERESNAFSKSINYNIPGIFCSVYCNIPYINLIFPPIWRKEMFYLTTHSTHLYLRLYGVGHMVKDHSNSERGNLLPPHGLLFLISSKGSFICTIPHTG